MSEQENRKWSAESSIAYILRNGAKPTRDKATGMPMLDLPTVLGLKFLSAVDYLKKKHGVRIRGSQHHQLWSPGNILHYITVR